MVKTQLFIGVALIAGVAIGYFVRPSERAAASEDSAEYVAKKRPADKGESASVKALRKRIAELERLLAARGAEFAEAMSNVVAATKGEPPKEGRPRMNPREWLENLKKNEPARYAQMTNRMARWRQRRMDRAHRKVEFLSSIDTSHMSAGAKKTHDELQELIARRENLEDQMHEEDLTEEQRHQLMDQMRETDRAMRRLNQQERTNLIEETAKNLGFEGEAVKEISATLQEVIQATDSNRHGDFPPPPDGGAPGSGGPNAGDPGGR